MTIYHESDKRAKTFYMGEEIECGVTGGYLHFEGDILVPESDREESDPEGGPGGLVARAFIRKSVRLWPKGIVPFKIDEKMAEISKRAVRAAIDHWQRKTDIRFVERDKQRAYVLFTKGKGGCKSAVGCQGNKQEIWLGGGCAANETKHEIGHAVGMFHEHTRPDRDDFIEIVWDNVPNGKRNPDFRKKSLSAGVTETPYDLASIMHYKKRRIREGADHDSPSRR